MKTVTLSRAIGHFQEYVIECFENGEPYSPASTFFYRDPTAACECLFTLRDKGFTIDVSELFPIGSTWINNENKWVVTIVSTPSGTVRYSGVPDMDICSIAWSVFLSWYTPYTYEKSEIENLMDDFDNLAGCVNLGGIPDLYEISLDDDEIPCDSATARKVFNVAEKIAYLQLLTDGEMAEIEAAELPILDCVIHPADLATMRENNIGIVAFVRGEW